MICSLCFLTCPTRWLWESQGLCLGEGSVDWPGLLDC